MIKKCIFTVDDYIFCLMRFLSTTVKPPFTAPRFTANPDLLQTPIYRKPRFTDFTACMYVCSMYVLPFPRIFLRKLVSKILIFFLKSLIFCLVDVVCRNCRATEEEDLPLFNIWITFLFCPMVRRF